MVTPEILIVGLEVSVLPSGVVYAIEQSGLKLQPGEYLQLGADIAAVVDYPGLKQMLILV
jgi:hypothetical protein